MVPTPGVNDQAAVTRAHTTAKADGAPPAAAARVATITAGASSRKAVRLRGWGTTLAATPTAQPSHSPSEATVRTGSLPVWRASARAGPTVKGRATHNARSSHGRMR